MQPYTGIIELDDKEIRWETTFDQSIKFKCTNCGYCCTSSNVELSDEELLKIKDSGEEGFSEDFLTDEGQASKRIKGSDKEPCLFLGDSKLCNVYEHRPSVCRLYPFKIVPVSENLVKIDVTKSCKSILKKHFAEENEVDFGNLVAEFLKHSFSKNRIYKAQLLHETVKDFLDKEAAVDECLAVIVAEVKLMNHFEQIWDLLDSFEKTRLQHKATLRRSNVQEYIKESMNNYKSATPDIKPNYEPEFFRGSHNRPYQSIDLSRNKVYYFSIGENEVHFSNEKKSYPISSISRKTLSGEAANFLSEYVQTLWKRQITRQKIEQKVHDSMGKIPSFTIQLQEAKKKFMLFSFFMDAISHHKGHGEITLSDAQESVLPFDLIFLNMR